MIRVLAIGKKHESWVDEGIQRYEKRSSKPWDAEWVLLAHSSHEAERARQDESERILARLKSDDFVILLDERGKLLSSPQLASSIETQLASSRQIVMIIGGAYGVNEALTDRADLVWSLSPLVFPHQLVRLILTEQLYRAQSIASNHPYHHG